MKRTRTEDSLEEALHAGKKSRKDDISPCIRTLELVLLNDNFFSLLSNSTLKTCSVVSTVHFKQCKVHIENLAFTWRVSTTKQNIGLTDKRLVYRIRKLAIQEQDVALLDRSAWTRNNLTSKMVTLIKQMPTSVQHLQLGDSFDYLITDKLLSDNIISLRLGQGYTRSTDLLPKRLRTLTIEGDVGVELLPNSLERLSLTGLFTKSVARLPPNITHLTLGPNFNHKVENLPESITHLQLGYKFDQSVDNLPKNLLKLSIKSRYFDSTLNSLPVTLQYLRVGIYNPPGLFNKPVNNLPDGLVTLKLYSNFDRNIDKLPDTVKYLYLSLFYNTIISRVPPNLQVLQFGRYFMKDIHPDCLRLRSFSALEIRMNTRHPYVPLFSMFTTVNDLNMFEHKPLQLVPGVY